MEILKFYPIYKEAIWGGDNLNKIFNRDIPSKKTGESWDLTCRTNDMSVVCQGKYKDRTFLDVINTNRKNFLGNKLEHTKDFPLLIKIIDANDNLSIQVHPDDDFANKIENLPYGKSEMWYVEKSESGTLIAGVNLKTSTELRNSIKDNSILNYLNYEKIKKGSVIDIPAGLVHAITSGNIVYEIQQNSDTTYRLFDYNRIDKKGKSRELHIEKGCDATKCQLTSQALETGDVSKEIVKNNLFTVDLIVVNNVEEQSTDPDHFTTLTCVEGEATIEYGNKKINLIKGDTVFIPANLGDYKIFGTGKFLKAYVSP
ncbi:MAG: type I phosphomannose isomerase catalytic subunit [Lachnospirales bacterium]